MRRNCNSLNVFICMLKGYKVDEVEFSIDLMSHFSFLHFPLEEKKYLVHQFPSVTSMGTNCGHGTLLPKPSHKVGRNNGLELFLSF